MAAHRREAPQRPSRVGLGRSRSPGSGASQRFSFLTSRTGAQTGSLFQQVLLGPVSPIVDPRKRRFHARRDSFNSSQQLRVVRPGLLGSKYRRGCGPLTAGEFQFQYLHGIHIRQDAQGFSCSYSYVGRTGIMDRCPCETHPAGAFRRGC